MKFYILENTDTGAIVTCELTVQRCRDVAEAQGISEWRIDLNEVEVTPESIRRLLGQMGGFAKDTRTVREFPKRSNDPDLTVAQGFLDQLADASHVLDEVTA